MGYRISRGLRPDEKAKVQRANELKQAQADLLDAQMLNIQQAETNAALQAAAEKREQEITDLQLMVLGGNN